MKLPMNSVIRRYSSIMLLLTLVSLPITLKAQAHKVPVPIEVFFGDHQLYFEMVVAKQFAPESRLGFFTVATFSAEYNDLSDVDITIPAHLFYTFWKGFSVIGGGSANSVAGFAPYTGFQHTFASRQILAVTEASFYLNSENDFKIFGIYEFKPPINEKWSFYTRLQFIYNTSLKEGTHNRSFLYLRAGVQRESIMFGLGANLDQYGPFKSFEDNYGVFVRYNLD